MDTVDMIYELSEQVPYSTFVECCKGVAPAAMSDEQAEATLKRLHEATLIRTVDTCGVCGERRYNRYCVECGTRG
ncbi:MAG: hypothetical protein Q4C85_07270 [Actinomyces sp.]|uniref:hypothetical protein n=1 Tax=Actinomyces sp. TaxID=29317 RepID=UPI0026DB6739|nr:hypothetical protein [Actinomyces sp.]MDO4243543.1 hypothetical protein [Actinomyces sp.]